MLESSLSDVLMTNEPSNYDLRKHYFDLPQVKTEMYGKHSIRYIAPKIWEMIPIEIRNIKTLNGFKKSIRSWRLRDCPCRLCKQYIANVGFI